jgi:hypothetical protein
MDTDTNKKVGHLQHGYMPAPARPSLSSMPLDVLRIIVWDQQLSESDVAALRLSGPEFAYIAATRLFYRIIISNLKRDRDSFLTICQSPHLAQHVHEVEWLELSWYECVFTRLLFHLDECTGSAAPGMDDDSELVSELYADTTEDDYDYDLVHHLCRETRAAFWLTNSISHPAGVTGVTNTEFPTFDDNELARQSEVDGFQDTFKAAISRLPNLHTFSSRPMSATRLINPESSWPVAAGLLQRYLDWEPIQAFPLPHINDGLFLFLLPAMDRANSTVTRLKWADEYPGTSYLRRLPASAFERLKSVEPCFTPVNDIDYALYKKEIGLPWGSKHFAALDSAFSRAAPTLRHLSISLDQHASPDMPTPTLQQALFGMASAPGCRLRSLRLKGMECYPELLIVVIRANAHSLRHLTFEDVPVRKQLVEQLRRLGTLSLETMQVIRMEDDDVYRCEPVDERDLVRYVNGEAKIEERVCRIVETLNITILPFLYTARRAVAFTYGYDSDADNDNDY